MNTQVAVLHSSQFAPSINDFDAWCAEGIAHMQTIRDTQWRLADWLYVGHGQWPNKFREFARQIGIADPNIKAALWVVEHYPKENRDQQIAFDFYKEMRPADASQREALLKDASNLTVTEVRRKIRQSHREYELPQDRSVQRFNLLRWSMAGIRWLKQQMASTPIDQWSQERREAIKHDLREIVQIYNQM